MSVKSKKILSIIVYYTLAVLALSGAGFFVWTTIAQALPMWAKIIYYVWSGLVIGAVIFDIICTSTGEAKQVSGLIIYVLSVLAVLMSMILYLVNTTRTGLVGGFFNIYLSTVLISLITTGYMIATWCVGESGVEHATAEDELNKKKRG